MVRFNNRLVFDYGYTLGCTGTHANIVSPGNFSKAEKSDTIRNFKRVSPMPVPNINCRYSTTPRINNDLGGAAVGAMSPASGPTTSDGSPRRAQAHLRPTRFRYSSVQLSTLGVRCSMFDIPLTPPSPAPPTESTAPAVASPPADPRTDSATRAATPPRPPP